MLLYLETGRVVRSTPAAETTAPTETVPEESAAEASPIQPPVFTAEDTARVSITYNCGYRPDIEALLTQTLDWDLTGEEPTVLILHTHTTESYTQTENSTYEESSAFRTLEEACNMLAVGDRVAETLEAGGISVIHDRTFHDYPSYSGSYAASRETVETYLKEYPSIRLVLDLHRDAAEDAYGNQISTSAAVSGQDSAQLMIVAGSDAGGLNFPNWQENLSLALKLHAVLEDGNPGICRPINFCAQRYNEDLTSGSLLIEVGAAGNTLEEALTAAKALGDAILALSHGSGESEN